MGLFDQNLLLEQLGDPYTNAVVARFHRFAFVPNDVVDGLSQDALHQDWGRENYALKFYLSVVVPWSIEQGDYTHSHNQLYVTAGHLQTRYGTPLYLVFERNVQSGRQPWVLRIAGSQISAPELPIPPEIPLPAQIPLGAEIVMMHDHILSDHPDRIPFLAETPRVAQMCAISGAVQWSLNRNLEFSYWYYGKMHHLVPLYLQSREDITCAPDAIAPIQINRDNLLVRTVLKPHMPYAKARVAVKRHDQLPPWLLAAWSEFAERLSESEIEDLE
ncbi:MAG: DUF3825 domain-containing protein [Planctomycetaceae bacterium]